MSTIHDIAINGPVWRLSSGEAMRLPRESRARWLRLRSGRLWVTADRHPNGGNSDLLDDCWLGAGDTLRLEAGESAVAEAWPSASFEVLEAAPMR